MRYAKHRDPVRAHLRLAPKPLERPLEVLKRDTRKLLGQPTKLEIPERKRRVVVYRQRVSGKWTRNPSLRSTQHQDRRTAPRARWIHKPADEPCPSELTFSEVVEKTSPGTSWSSWPATSPAGSAPMSAFTSTRSASRMWTWRSRWRCNAIATCSPYPGLAKADNIRAMVAGDICE